jgi:hypothetical protein
MRTTFAIAAAVVATLAASLPATQLLAAEKAHPAAVQQSGAAAVPQDVKPTPLKLTDAQRAKIKQALSSKDTEETFTSKKTKASKDFVPTVGAKLPKNVKPHGIPNTLLAEVPALKDYGYAKMKHQIAIVDATSDKIVELLPES